MKAPKSVSIKGCDKVPCKFHKGSDLSAEIRFTTNEATKTLTPQLSAKVWTLKVPINLPAEHQNGCAHLKEGQCPLKANDEAVYFVETPVKSSFPSMKTEIEVNLVGDNKKSHMCFKIDAQLV